MTKRIDRLEPLRISEVRYREEWEARCPLCQEWQPLDFDFWDPGRMTRCLTCWRVYSKLMNRHYGEVEAVRACRREGARVRYWARREKHIKSVARWREEHKEARREYDHRYRAAHREEINARRRELYAQKKATKA